MAIQMPSPASAAAKWTSVTPGRQAYYTTGVQGAAQKWQTGADGANDNWGAGVQTAVAERRYATGVSGRGGYYSTQAATIGTQRWGQGVAQAGPRYETGVQPIFSALSALTLTPRGPKGSPGNMIRVSEVVAAERAARR